MNRAVFGEGEAIRSLKFYLSARLAGVTEVERDEEMRSAEKEKMRRKRRGKKKSGMLGGPGHMVGLGILWGR